MKKALYALIVAVVLIISLIAHSFCFGTGDIVADIKGIYYDILNDGITETKTFSELKFDYSLFETALDELEYFNYNQLNSIQQGMYKTILDAVVTMKTGNINLGKGTKKDAVVSMYAVKYDYPELFWLGFEYGTGEKDDTVYLRFDKGDLEGYTYTHDERVKMMEELQTAVKSILDECITADMTDFQKEVAIHDWICQNVVYDTDADVFADNIEDRKRENPLSWTAYGAIVNRVAVCEGYSKAFQLLMYSVGINSNLICGEVTDGSPHMWNTVMLDNEWYYVDVLWDDVDEDIVIHTFLNVDAEMISKTHTSYSNMSYVKDNSTIYSGEYNLKLPTANSKKMNYYVVNETDINSDDEFFDVVVENVKLAAADGRDSVEFYYSYKEMNEDVVNYDIRNNKIFSAVKGDISGFKGFKYVAYSYGTFILEISR